MTGGAFFPVVCHESRGTYVIGPNSSRDLTGSECGLIVAYPARQRRTIAVLKAGNATEELADQSISRYFASASGWWNVLLLSVDVVVSNAASGEIRRSTGITLPLLTITSWSYWERR